MSLRTQGSTVYLEGDTRIEDAEALLQALLLDTRPAVNLGACRSLHAALAQILLAFQPEITGAPENDFLSQTLLPAIARARTRDS